jgi:hypothetical protein
MSLRFIVQRNVLRALLAIVAIGSLVRAAELMPPALYEVTTETGMPHLEENLRYSTTHETRCFAHQDLSAAFPVLEHASFKGCRLDEQKRTDDVISYLLICEGKQGTTGEAVWELAKHRIMGTLHVKLGGKNMTFYQRVTATPVGPC